MGNKWIIDVLDDLATFARRNDMSRLSEQLELAALTATAEIARERGEAPIGVLNHGAGPGKLLEEGRTGGRA